MSRVERLVTSLEVSRKLKDLGIIQESCFYWVRFPYKKEFNLMAFDPSLWLSDDLESAEIPDWGSGGCEGIYFENVMEKISAFTSEEIQEMNNSLLTSRVEKQAEILIYRLTDKKRPAKNIEKELKKLNQNLKEWINK